MVRHFSVNDVEIQADGLEDTAGQNPVRIKVEECESPAAAIPGPLFSPVAQEGPVDKIAKRAAPRGG